MSDFQYVPANIEELRQRYRQALEKAGTVTGAEHERQELSFEDALAIEQEWRSEQLATSLATLEEVLKVGITTLKQSLAELASEQAALHAAQASLQQHTEAFQRMLAVLQEQSGQHLQHGEVHTASLNDLAEQLCAVQKQQKSDSDRLTSLENQINGLSQQQQQQTTVLAEIIQRLEQAFPKRSWR